MVSLISPADRPPSAAARAFSESTASWYPATGKKKLVLAGMWTESCLAVSALSAIATGYEVYIITDASGGGSPESHEMALRRLIQAGAIPLTAGTYVKELQRDWARDTADEVRIVLTPDPPPSPSPTT